MSQSFEEAGLSLETTDMADGLGSSDLIKPLFFGGMATLAAIGSAGLAGWALVPTLVLGAIAGINGLFLAAYLQEKAK